MIEDYEIKHPKSIMQKIEPYIEFILILIIIQSSILMFTNEEADEEMLRFRILAHSNAPVDQQMKEDVRREIESLVNNVLTVSSSMEELGDNFAAIEDDIIGIARTVTNGKSVKLERTDALFPPKRSGLIITPQAHYDAFILTIGSGRGDNWWCSLFPNICYPNQEDQKEEKVTFFIWEWIKGLFE